MTLCLALKGQNHFNMQCIHSEILKNGLFQIFANADQRVERDYVQQFISLQELSLVELCQNKAFVSCSLCGVLYEVGVN